MNNRDYAKSSEFQRLCEEHEIVPTKRQVSKFRMNKGVLYITIKGPKK